MNPQQYSFQLAPTLVGEIDEWTKIAHFKNRNAFVEAALENFIAQQREKALDEAFFRAGQASAEDPLYAEIIEDFKYADAEIFE